MVSEGIVLLESTELSSAIWTERVGYTRLVDVVIAML